jgi:hypothetical protein
VLGLKSSFSTDQHEKVLQFLTALVLKVRQQEKLTFSIQRFEVGVGVG